MAGSMLGRAEERAIGTFEQRLRFSPLDPRPYSLSGIALRTFFPVDMMKRRGLAEAMHCRPYPHPARSRYAYQLRWACGGH